MRTLLYSALLGLMALPVHAAVVSFGTVQTGVGTLGAASSTTLNTGAGTTGFNGFFTAPYNSLGSTSTNTTANGPDSGTTRISSTSSFLGSVLNNAGTNRLTFNYAFDGNSGTSDTFRAFWCTVATCTAPTVASSFTTTTLINTGGAFFSGLATSGPAFVDGTTYFLVFELDEVNAGGGGNNSAAGFNNVQLIPEPTTTVGLLLLSLGGLARKFKRS